MNLEEKLAEHREQLPIHGLGVFILVAGLSKFVIPDFWLGYEPQFIVELLPLTARQLTLAGGGLEALLGLVLLSGRKTFEAASLTAVWLSAITLQVARLGLWDLAIRDLGLVFYAASVALMNYQRS